MEPIDSFHISGRPWQPRTLSAIGWPPRTANFVLALSTDERHFRSLQLGLSFLSLLTFFFMKCNHQHRMGVLGPFPTGREQNRADAEDLVEWCVCTRTWSVEIAWKATTKTSLAQKARAPKRSLARKEILISAVRLTVDLSPFLQLTLSYEIGSRWQRQLCLTALHICR